MTLKEANFEVEKLSNELNRLLDEKEALEGLVDVQAIDTTKIRVDGGISQDKLLTYVQLKEWKRLDSEIQYHHKLIQAKMNWIDRELKALNKYEQIEKLIVYYKEIYPKKMTWASVSSLVHYSEAQCKRIYKRYKKKRNIEDDPK